VSEELTIVCIGKATQDVFLTSKEAFTPKTDLDGKQYEHLPLGSKIDIDDVVFSTGGNATNAAVTFARQGMHAVYIWNLGTDLSSNVVLDDLDKEGVNTKHTTQDDSNKTSYSTILLAPGGERTILNYHGSIPKSDASSLDLSKLETCDWLYLSALGDIDLLEVIVSRAKQNNVKILLNPAGSELASIDKLKTILEDVEIIVVNKEEAGKLVEGQTIDELVRHLNNYCPVAIVTDGPNGSIVSDGKDVVMAGMYENIPVIDRTGGGDAFSSGFLAKFSHGASLKDSMIFASANSTSVVSKIGAKPGILHKNYTLHEMPIREEKF
jgi:ribokinase